MLIFIHKSQFLIEFESENSLYFKNEIIFDWNTKVKKSLHFENEIYISF